MTQDEILKGNKLIAEFMKLDCDSDAIDYDHGTWRKYIDPYTNTPTVDSYTPSPILYHTSWDWLMPVCMKIREAGYFPFNNFYLDIEELWNVVVKFVEWHNTSTK